MVRHEEFDTTSGPAVNEGSMDLTPLQAAVPTGEELVAAATAVAAQRARMMARLGGVVGRSESEERALQTLKRLEFPDVVRMRAMSKKVDSISLFYKTLGESIKVPQTSAHFEGIEPSVWMQRVFSAIDALIELLPGWVYQALSVRFSLIDASAVGLRAFVTGISPFLFCDAIESMIMTSYVTWTAESPMGLPRSGKGEPRHMEGGLGILDLPGPAPDPAEAALIAEEATKIEPYATVEAHLRALVADPQIPQMFRVDPRDASSAPTFRMIKRPRLDRTDTMDMLTQMLRESVARSVGTSGSPMGVTGGDGITVTPGFGPEDAVDGAMM